MMYYGCYRDYGPDPPAWLPDPEIAATTNIGQLLERRGKEFLGSRYKDPMSSFSDFQEFSVSNPEVFWRAIFNEMCLSFSVPPQCILREDPSYPGGQWLPGAHLNPAKNCLSLNGKRTLDDTVLIWRDEEDDGMPVKKMTLEELRMEVWLVAFAIETLRLEKGSAIAIDMPMDVNSVVIYLAIVLAGYVVVSVADSFAPSEIATRLRISKAKAIAASSASAEEFDDQRCCDNTRQFPDADLHEQQQLGQAGYIGIPSGYPSGESRIERAWAHWKKLGQPKLIVAPMVDNSELPFRMLCRKYGAEAAYTPMLHSRIFTENEKYRSEEFTTCKEDRPLFVQFCANDPDTLLEAARRVEPYCDYVDINLGCPQRIARRGNYGAFLMDNLPLVKSLVEKLALNLNVPVSCKIRIFPDLQTTINYARMLEDAGCSLLAVHGRTRDEKDGKKFRANWDAIKAVRNAVRIPVLANGNIRHMDDVQSCLKETGVDGVLSAETLLENPALFAGFGTAEWALGSSEINKDGELDQTDLLVEYLKLCEKYPVPWRMVRSHVHKLLGEWFRIHPHVREDLNAQSKLTFEFLYGMVNRLRELGSRIPLYLKDSRSEMVSSNGIVA